MSPYHHGNLREALLEQAALTVRERGVEALSLRELAREVGVSHGAPRRHFPDRQALLDALVLDGFARLGAELRRAATIAGGDDFAATLRACAHAYVRFATRDAALLELMFASKETDPEGEHERAALAAFAPMLELILRGQAEGVLDPGDPEQVGLVLLAAIHGIAALRNVGMVSADQLRSLVDDATAQLLRGARGPVTETAGAA